MNDTRNLSALKPALVWKHFAQIVRIPRPSSHEEKIRRQNYAAKKIQKQKTWTPELGWGRLAAAKAVQSAKAAGAPAKPAAPKNVAGKKKTATKTA